MALADYTPDSALPYSTQAEQAVLGAILLDSSVFDEVLDYIKSPDFFFQPIHRLSTTTRSAPVFSTVSRSSVK